MQINKQIYAKLIDCGIDREEGTLVLMAIYHGFEVNKLFRLDLVTAVKKTYIVEKQVEEIVWNIPLYNISLADAVMTPFDWVIEYNEMFRKINPKRTDNLADVTRRMMDFCRKYPHLGKEYILQGTKLYLTTAVSGPEYLKRSLLFIYEGKGKDRVSQLLTWAEIAYEKKSKPTSDLKGKVLN